MTLEDAVSVASSERDDARRWAVSLEGELAVAQERARSDLEREHARWRAADARAVAAEGELARTKEALRAPVVPPDAHETG